MSVPTDYGKWYFGVRKANNEVLMLHADSLDTGSSGSLSFSQRDKDDKYEYKVTLVLAPGEWKAAWAASVLDGRPLCVDDDQVKP